MALYRSDRLEYLSKVAILAATMLPTGTTALSPNEIIALEDRQAVACEPRATRAPTATSWPPKEPSRGAAPD